MNLNYDSLGIGIVPSLMNMWAEEKKEEEKGGKWKCAQKTLTLWVFMRDFSHVSW